MYSFRFSWKQKFKVKRSKKKNFLHERAKRMRNGSLFASFRFEAKTFFCKTGAPYSCPVPPLKADTLAYLILPEVVFPSLWVGFAMSS
jgi:hypothetical protein